MANEEHLQILKEGVEAWNRWRQNNRVSPQQPDLSDANLGGAILNFADLSDANLGGAILTLAVLSHADLSGAVLYDANLSRAVLCNANLTLANLSGADLSHADLSHANLSGAVLSHLDLSHLDLSHADLSHADLSHANLSRANLSRADLGGADLSGTNLENAELTRSRFIGCNLKDAVFDNAWVTDIDVQRLRSLPKPPEQLRILGNHGEILLIGSEAREFFHLPAIVEVYVTAELTQRELGFYHFHLGEVHHEGIATGVYLVGHRHERGDSVLRFQAKFYAEIYQVLPDLLAPFRMSQAVDWKQTLQAMPAEEREEAIAALVKIEAEHVEGRWRLAKHMADGFEGYEKARVSRISMGTNQWIRVDVVTNQEMADRLLFEGLPTVDNQRRLLIETRGNAPVNVIEGDYVSTQHFHGGHFRGCSFGDHNSLTNYFGVVDNLSTIEEDIKQKLKEAREAIERADLSDADKADVVDELNKLTAELEKPEKDDGRVQRYWNRIKEVAPTVASILASAASMGKLLGVS